MEEKIEKLKELNKSRLFYKEEEKNIYFDVLYGFTPMKKHIETKKTRKKIEKEIFKLIQEL